MNPGPQIFVALCAVALLVVPRRWAPLPFIMAACYISIGQAIEVGAFTFTAIRLLVVVGIARVIMRGERLAGGVNGLDRWMIVWAVWACASGFFHENPNETLVNRLGLVYNSLGIYFLLRIFCTSFDDVIGLCRATAFLLIPVAIEMLYEIQGRSSLFYAFEGRPNPLYVRGERIRAYGPFAHPILAGTVGAVCLPLMIGMWAHRRKTALAGILACLAIVAGSASSGPIFSAVAAIGGLYMWRFRYKMKQVRWGIVGTYMALAVAMKAPVYYLIARVDVVDGSTGYHRALLIDAALQHLGEWWIAGTDYTRHWAPSPGATPQHTDITNQYISMAVLGGLPLMLMFIAVIAKAFSLVGERLHAQTGCGPAADQRRFMHWALGAALFSHVATFLSVSYFDQSFVFMYLILGAIGSARNAPAEQSLVRPATAAAIGPSPTPGSSRINPAWRGPVTASSR